MVMRQLHPGVKWQFRISGFFGILILMIFIGVWVGALVSGILLALGLGGIVGVLIFFYLVLFIIFIVLIEVYARLAYKFWKYEFTNDQLRIERGIIWKRYSNIPYQRVQNVDITRGVIARILGFSSVNIQTAGYSMPANGHGMSSEGYIPAVSMGEAEKIREFVMKKILKRHHGGL
jgi:putative membrane protein